MRKISYLVFAMTLLLVISCNKDDDTADSPAVILPKKSISTYHQDGEIITSEYVYDGNKIVSIMSSDTTKIMYTYTGDLITKIELKDKNNVAQLTEEYTYVDGKVVTNTRKWASEPYDYKKVYTYNTDGTISYKGFKINKQTKEEVEYKNGTYTLTEGNITKEIRYDISVNSNQILFQRISTYEYDTKNLSSKNIIGLNSLIEFGEIMVPFTHNIIKSTTSGPFGGVEESIYTYDEKDFPIEEKEYDNGNLYITTQYFY